MTVAIKSVDMTEKEAIQLALEIERTESALKQMKAELKEYVQVNGELNTGEKVWLLDQSISWSFDADGMKKIAEGLVLEGKNPWQYLNITPATLRKLDWNENVLENYGKKRITNRFVSRKV